MYGVFLSFLLQKNEKEKGFMLQEISRVFTKQYQDDVAFLEFKYKMRQYVKLKNESESIDNKIERLKNCGYTSKCHIEVGGF